MIWLVLAIGAYFLNSITAVIDKFLLKKSVSSSIAYTFYVGLLSIFAVILIPFGVVFLSGQEILKDILAGMVFLLAILFFLKSVKKNEVSIAVTVIGGFTPIFVLILSFIFLGETLSQKQILAFILLVLGGILMSLKKSGGQARKFSPVGIELSILAAFVFSVYYVMVKSIFSGQPFLSAFFWSRMGSFLLALTFLSIPIWRKIIFETKNTAGRKGGALFVFNKILGASAFILLNYSIKLGSVTLINAIQGIQYLFLFILVVLLSKKFPKVLEEKLTIAVIFQKVGAIIIIGLGLILIYF